MQSKKSVSDDTTLSCKSNANWVLLLQGDKTCFGSKKYLTKRWINCKTATQKCTVKQVYWITTADKNIRENSFLWVSEAATGGILLKKVFLEISP